MEKVEVSEIAWKTYLNSYHELEETKRLLKLADQEKLKLARTIMHYEKALSTIAWRLPTTGIVDGMMKAEALDALKYRRDD